MSTRSEFHLHRGFDIRLEGEAKKQLAEIAYPSTFALKPSDFLNVTRPKLLVEKGDNVRAGTPLFYDKRQEKVRYCAPVSGEIVNIIRGEKRKLLEIVILADKEIEYEPLSKYSLEEIATLSRQQLVDQLSESGAWPHLIQRPFGLVASPEETPRSIFLSAFDSHPLAPDDTFSLANCEPAFKAGLAALRLLSGGDLHLSLPKGKDSSYFASQKGVQYHTFRGPHPVGNVGVQIHHIQPINKGDIVWTTTPFGVVQIGRIFLEGRYDTSTRIAVTGSEVLQPQYYSTHVGSSIKHMCKGNLRKKNVRYVSGNVLTGERIEEGSHLGFYHRQLTVIEEGNRAEPFGWILPSVEKLSFHRGIGLLSFLFPKKKYKLDSNTHGEGRAFAQTGVLEKVMPMDILPTYLIKAILAEDCDEMEALGIYEVIEEDMALCEFVDLSKHEVQSILRQGLTLIQNA